MTHIRGLITMLNTHEPPSMCVAVTVHSVILQRRLLLSLAFEPKFSSALHTVDGINPALPITRNIP